MIDKSIVIVWISTVVLILALAGLVHLVACICKRVKAYKNEKNTNYGRIKRISIDEMVELLSWLQCEGCPAFEMCDTSSKGCGITIRKWLESEAENDGRKTD